MNSYIHATKWQCCNVTHVQTGVPHEVAGIQQAYKEVCSDCHMVARTTTQHMCEQACLGCHVAVRGHGMTVG